MNKARIKQLNKKIDKLLGNKKTPIFPLLGGAWCGELTRKVTLEEEEILHSKGLPCPILVSLDLEQEFQEYLKS